MLSERQNVRSRPLQVVEVFENGGPGFNDYFCQGISTGSDRTWLAEKILSRLKGVHQFCLRETECVAIKLLPEAHTAADWLGLRFEAGNPAAGMAAKQIEVTSGPNLTTNQILYTVCAGSLYRLPPL